MSITKEYIMDIYGADLSPLFQRGLKHALDEFEKQCKQPLIDSLKQIEQFSDVGSDFLAVMRMKEIASNILSKSKQ